MLRFHSPSRTVGFSSAARTLAFEAAHYVHEAGLIAIVGGAIGDGELSDGVDGHLRHLVLAKICRLIRTVFGAPGIHSN